MNRFLSIPLGIMLCAQVAVASADPSGVYDVHGQNPDGSTYQASVVVSKVGDTFAVTYTLPDNTRVDGTAIGDDEVLAVGYGEGANTGVVLIARAGDSWKGAWAYFGSQALGYEEWIRR